MRVAACMVASMTLLCTLVAGRPQAVHGEGVLQAIQVSKTEKPPLVDGALNDPEWQRAAVFEDFRTLHPSAGKAPSERTVVYLTYDRENIYVAVHAFDSEPDKIRSQATRRDNPEKDDWIAFCLDTRNDELSAVFFMLTPSGLQIDGTLNANGSPNTTFDTQWSSAARRTADGWTVEMAIPFKRLPFHWNEQVVMGFKVARFISRTGEEADCPEISPDRAAHLAQLRKVQFSNIQRSLLSADAPLVDIREIYKRKLRLKDVPDIDTYEGRVREWGDASVVDYLVFPARKLKPAGKVFHFGKKLQENRVASAFERLEYFSGKRVDNLERFLQRTQTALFIVIKNDNILYEKYFNGYRRDSIVTSFSVAKSFVSTLVGIAIDEGLIASVSDPITKYIPELGKRDERFTRITIRDLLLMSSGIRYEEDAPYYDGRITYLEPDLRRAALEKTAIVEVPGKHWLYNNYHPLLVGMILERVTGRSVADYLQEKL